MLINDYARKIIGKDKLYDLLPKDVNLVVSHVASEPKDTLKAILERVDTGDKVITLSHLLMLSERYYPYSSDKFNQNSFFVSASERKLIREGKINYVPCHFSSIPSVLGRLDNLVLILQVSPMDSCGNFSLGLSCDYVRDLVDKAKIVILEVNKQMPTTSGDNKIHISAADHLVLVNKKLPEILINETTEVERLIGDICASIINDGDTIQVGIGGIPNAILESLVTKKDLGIHSEMISDGVMDLVTRGVVTNKSKEIHRNKIVCSFILGSKKLYNFVNNNSSVELYPIEYVNSPITLSKMDNMVSINTCLEVDLLGQVSSESIGGYQISGIGGQADFARGVNYSKNGRSIIALRSTIEKDGVLKSTIVTRLGIDTPLSLTRNDVSFIATEFGIVDLRGKTTRERAEAIVSIAHPLFREELMRSTWVNN